MDIRVVTLTEEQLLELLTRAAELGAERALAHVLPPFSQHSLPEGVSSRAFLAACRAGCPHRNKGRTLFVERVTWAAWRDCHPRQVPRAAPPSPPGQVLDARELLEQALTPRRRGDAAQRQVAGLNIEALTNEALRPTRPRPKK